MLKGEPWLLPPLPTTTVAKPPLAGALGPDDGSPHKAPKASSLFQTSGQPGVGLPPPKLVAQTCGGLMILDEIWDGHEVWLPACTWAGGDRRERLLSRTSGRGPTGSWASATAQLHRPAC